MLQIWDGRTFRYYSDDELAFASSLLEADGVPDEYGFTAYVLKDRRLEIAFGPFRQMAREIENAAAELIFIAEKRCPLMRKMQDEKRIRSQFLDIPGRGSFFFVEAIFTYDWPEIFICQEDDSQLWLFEEVDDDDYKEAWVAVRITQVQLSHLKAGVCSIQSLFRDAKAPFLLVTHWWNGNKTVCKEFDKLPYPEVGKNDVYYGEVPH